MISKLKYQNTTTVALNYLESSTALHVSCFPTSLQFVRLLHDM